MANQPIPTPNGVRRVSSNRWLAIGWLLMGLLIGLLIGWVVWPVQWSDAEPDNLRPDARAHFISATADAYVASGGQDPNTALARMQSFADPQAAVADAIAFFQQSSDPKRAIRVVNLRSLSSALGASALGITQSTLPDTPEISWSNWLLGALTGLLLLFGGGWILRRWLVSLRSTQPAASGPPTPASQTAWVPPFPPVSPGIQSPPADSGWQPSAPPDQASPGQANLLAQAVRPVQMETWDDPNAAPAFGGPVSPPSIPSSTRPRPSPSPTDAEPLRRIVPGQERLAPIKPDADPDAEPEQADTINSFIDFSRVAADEEDGDDGDDEDGDDDDDVQAREDNWKSWQPKKELPAIRKVLPDALDDDGEDDWDDALSDDALSNDDPLDDEDLGEAGWELDEEETEKSPATPALWVGGTRPAPAPPALPPPDEDDNPESTILPTVKSVLSNLGWGEKENSAKSRDGKTIGSYVAEYNIGIMAYDQSFTITSTGGEGAPPLGACGMAISEELDKSAANSNNVRVLQVWLYDGMEVRTSSQYLVSPGLDKEALGEQAKSAGTITGEPLDIAPGMTFRIPAKNLMLDCRIVNADFLTAEAAPSPLRTVRVAMTARVAK